MAQYPRIDVVLGGYDLGTDQGLAALCSVVLIEAPDADGTTRRILVDPAHVGRRRFLMDALAQRGLTPSDIDLVVLTHAHWDHVQNLDVFEHAPIYLHPVERRYAQRPHRNDWATPQWTGAIIERRTRARSPRARRAITGHRRGGHAGALAGQHRHHRAAGGGPGRHHWRRPALRLHPENGDQPPGVLGRRCREAQHRAGGGAGRRDLPRPESTFRVAQSGEIEYLVPFKLTVNGIQPGMDGLVFPPPTQRVPWVMPGVEEQAARLAGGTPETTPT